MMHGVGTESAAPLQCLQLLQILTHFSFASIIAQGFCALVLTDKSTRFYTGDTSFLRTKRKGSSSPMEPLVQDDMRNSDS